MHSFLHFNNTSNNDVDVMFIVIMFTLNINRYEMKQVWNEAGMKWIIVIIYSWQNSKVINWSFKKLFFLGFPAKWKNRFAKISHFIFCTRPWNSRICRFSTLKKKIFLNVQKRPSEWPEIINLAFSWLIYSKNVSWNF